MCKKQTFIVSAIVLILLCALPFISAAQNRISGKIVDTDGAPVIGAAVIVKSTNDGTVTDIDGKWTINAKTDDVLSVSCVGYVPQDVNVGGRTTVDVILEVDATLLEDVVVVGYGVQKKSDITGAISSIKASDIANRSVTRVEQALQGKTAGVQMITTSGQPGSSPTIRVRGFSSNGSSDPLYVVDGLRVSDIGSIDPNTIASIEVLKDAASAAIYGAQAGNGVVLITTKTGSKGSSSITYDFQYSITDLTRIPETLNAEQTINLMKEQSPANTDDFIKLNYIDTKRWDGKSSTDWFDVAFNKGVQQRHSLSAQGANEKGSYFVSLNYLKENGIVKGDYDTFSRLTGTINADYQIKKWLKIGTTNTIERYERKSITDGGGQSNAYTILVSRVLTLTPLMADTYSPDALPDDMAVFLEEGKPLLKDENGNYYGCWLGGESVHPIVSAKANNNKAYGYNIQGTAFLDLTPVKGLVFTSKLGYRLSTSNSYLYQNRYYGSLGTSNLNANGVNRSTSSNIYYQWENFINFSRTFAKKHDLSVMAGMSYSDSNNTYIYAGVSNVMKDDPHFQDVSYAAGDATKSASGNQSYVRKLSYFGRLGYNYDNRYFIQGIFRADAADTAYLPKNNRWGYFPGVSLGWVMSNEDFFKKNDIISYVKIRGSWGQNGSISNLGGYRYSSSISQSAKGYPYDNTTDYVIAGAPNQVSNLDLKWETSEQIDLGLDLRMFRDRLSISADWFDKKTKDLIVTGTQLPMSVGNAAPPVNAGNVSNRGVELEIGWKDTVGDFYYSINGNLATLKNKVTYLDPTISDNRIYGGAQLGAIGSLTAFEVGYPVWYFYGYKVDHIDSETGEPVFADNDGIEGITAADKTYIGKPMPDFTYGITLNLGYKNFDLIVFGSGAHGNNVFSALGYSSIAYNYKYVYDRRWTPENPDNAMYARPGNSGGNNYIVSDASVYDASYFKIKQMQLGYSLPENLLRKTFLSNLRVYVSLDDFFCFTKYPGLDPEVSATATSGMGVDYGNYPNTKKIVFGVSVTF